MKYGYARVSTIQQDLEAQLQALEKENCDIIYSEKITGRKADREKFKELLEKLETDDVLVVTKLDRFARSTSDAIKIIEELFDKGVKVHVLNMGVVENTPTGRLIFNIMSAFAEFERDMIIERTQEGKAIAKQRENFKDGRPAKYNKKQIEHALELLKSHSYKEVVEMTGISKTTILRAKRNKNLCP